MTLSECNIKLNIFFARNQKISSNGNANICGSQRDIIQNLSESR